MSQTIRKQLLASVRSAVIKLGTQLLTDPKSGRLDEAYLATVAKEVAALRDRHVAVTIVSSGAIGAGVAELGLPKRPTDLARLQAVAAVGQRRLMDAWARAFEPFKMPVAQLLLTREDIDERTRFLNVRNTVHAAHELGAVPIINENDTISTDELVKITFGDNDILAAMVSAALRAHLLVLLTSVDGVLDADGKPVRLVESLEQVRALVRAEKSALGKGGMNSKIEAARMVTDAGEVMVVANGRDPNVLIRMLDGEEVGTLFAAPGAGAGTGAAKKQSSRNRWIGAARPAGTIVIDDGAAAALMQKNRSLLPAGVVSIEGDFAPGDVVAIIGPDRRTIARGLCNYAASDVLKIRGKKTAQVREMLGEAAYDEVVHRNNLVLG
jgi:glutamate 5-kinase